MERMESLRSSGMVGLSISSGPGSPMEVGSGCGPPAPLALRSRLGEPEGNKSQLRQFATLLRAETVWLAKLAGIL